MPRPLTLELVVWRERRNALIVGFLILVSGFAAGWQGGRASKRAEQAMDAGEIGVTGALLYRAVQCAKLAAPLRPGLVCD